MKLFVAGLPYDFDDIDLKEMFELYGTVLEVKLVADRATGKSKGFGFVNMPDNAEALETISTLNGTAIKGKKLFVQKADDNTGGGNNSNTRNSGRRY